MMLWMLYFTILNLSFRFSDASNVTWVGNYLNPYVPDSWNYNYSQIGGQSCGNNGTCSVTDKCGPKCWEIIPTVKSKAVNMCGGRHHQSPINIAQVEVNTALNPPLFCAVNDGCDNWFQYSNDYAFEVSFEGCGNLRLNYNSMAYTLIKMQFHTPSEHSIGGGLADAEIHLVHKASSGESLILSVRLAASMAPNIALAPFWDAAMKGAATDGSGRKPLPPYAIYSQEYKVSDSEKLLNPYEQLLPSSRNFYTYKGSLTTYPCTEGVEWIIYEELVSIGESDLQNLKMAVRSQQPYAIVYEHNGCSIPFANNRPVQPKLNRTIKKFVDNGHHPASTYHIYGDTSINNNRVHPGMLNRHKKNRSDNSGWCNELRNLSAHDNDQRIMSEAADPDSSANMHFTDYDNHLDVVDSPDISSKQADNFNGNLRNDIHNELNSLEEAKDKKVLSESNSGDIEFLFSKEIGDIISNQDLSTSQPMENQQWDMDNVVESWSYPKKKDHGASFDPSAAAGKPLSTFEKQKELGHAFFDKVSSLITAFEPSVTKMNNTARIELPKIEEEESQSLPSSVSPYFSSLLTPLILNTSVSYLESNDPIAPESTSDNMVFASTSAIPVEESPTQMLSSSSSTEAALSSIRTSESALAPLIPSDIDLSPMDDKEEIQQIVSPVIIERNSIKNEEFRTKHSGSHNNAFMIEPAKQRGEVLLSPPTKQVRSMLRHRGHTGGNKRKKQRYHLDDDEK